MFFLRLMRKVGKLIRGGVTPRQIALGAVIGTVLGFMPNFSLSVVILVALLILLNAHIGIALLGIVGGKILCLLLAPVTFRIGYFIIHSLGIEDVFRWLSNTPVIALMNFQVYAMVGAIPFMILFSWLFAVLMIKSVNFVRFKIAASTSRSPKIQKLAQNKIVRFFMWILFGKHKNELLEEAESKQPWLRKAGVIFLVTLAAFVTVMEILLLNVFLTMGIEKGLTAANGAEVNVEQAELSFVKGRLAIQKMQMTNPEEPSYNRMQIDSTEIDLSILDLLRKRLVMDQVAMRDVKTHVERTSPGKIYKKERRKPEKPKEEKPKVTEEKTVYDYIEQAKKGKKYAEKLQAFLEKRSQRAKAEKPARSRRRQIFDTAANRGYLAMSAKQILAKQPTILINKLHVAGIKMPFLKNSTNDIRGTNLSNQPELVDKPMTLSLEKRKPEKKTVADIIFHLYDTDKMNTLMLDIDNLNVEEQLDMAQDSPVVIEKAIASVKVDGEFSSKNLLLPFVIKLDNFQAHSREGKSIAGLSPKSTNRILKSIDKLDIKGAVTGSLSAPRPELDMKHLMSQLKGALKGAAKDELSKALKEKLQENTGDLQKKLEEEGGLSDKVKGLLGGDSDSSEKEKSQESSEEKDDSKDKVKDAIDSLF